VSVHVSRHKASLAVVAPIDEAAWAPRVAIGLRIARAFGARGDAAGTF
jgi:hypothetical protein